MLVYIYVSALAALEPGEVVALRTTARAASALPSASVTVRSASTRARLAVDQPDRGQLGELRAAGGQEGCRRDVVRAEQAADRVRGRVAGLSGVHDDHLEPHPAERERDLKARASTTDDDHVRVHASDGCTRTPVLAIFLAELATNEDRIRRRLRALREERGLSLDTVANAAGMAPSTLSRLENGKRRLAVARPADEWRAQFRARAPAA